MCRARAGCGIGFHEEGCVVGLGFEEVDVEDLHFGLFSSLGMLLCGEFESLWYCSWYCRMRGFEVLFSVSLKDDGMIELEGIEQGRESQSLEE